MATSNTSGRGRGARGRAAIVAVDPAPPMQCFKRGMGDACDVVTPVKLLYGHDGCRRSVFKCFLLNGGIFLGSMALYHVLIANAIHYILIYTWDSERATGVPATFIKPVERLLWAVVNVAWVFPIFFLAKVINATYFQEVADAAYRFLRGSSSTTQTVAHQRDALSRLTDGIADVIYSFVLQLLLLLQSVLVLRVPHVGVLLSLVYSSWITSLYCFEYTWLNSGWTLNRRLEYFERHWAYFLGFGLPFTLATYFLSFLYSTATFSLLFPIFIIMATVAEPIPSSRSLSFFGLVPESLAICTPSRQLTNRIMRSLRRRALPPR